MWYDVAVFELGVGAVVGEGERGGEGKEKVVFVFFIR